MGKGSGARNPARSIGQRDYAEKTIWCPEGGMHDPDPETGLCRKCEADRTPELPPGVDEQEAVT